MPIISVIIPVYNSEKYLRKCLDSVINQTLKDLEIICVNDGSTDQSLEILNEYINVDNRITVINQDNLGAGAARNKGLEVAKGEYIHFLDADDWLEPNAYELVYHYVKKSDTIIDICMFLYKKYDNETGAINYVDLFYILGKEKIKITCFEENSKFFIYTSVVPWNKLYKRSFIQDRFTFDEIICANDRTFYFKTLLNSRKIMLIKEYLINYRINNINSLVGIKRIKHFDCHFTAFQNTFSLFSNHKSNLLEMIIDVSMKDILLFYKKSAGIDKWNIFLKLNNYFNSLNLEEDSIRKYDWYSDYKIIKESHFVQNVNREHIIPIVFATNDNYAPYLACAIMSLIENASRDFVYDIYIFHTQLSEQYIRKLKMIEKKHPGVYINCLDVNNKIKNETLYSRSHYSIEMYYRLLIPEILFHYDKVLYLDCDIIVLSDISKLYKTNLDGYVLAGVSNFSNISMSAYIENVLKLKIDNYINSGVLLFNNKEFIESKIKERCFMLIKECKKYVCPDQDVINIACKDRILLVDDGWNFSWQHYIMNEKLNDIFKDRYDSAYKNIKILHYTTGIKPWKYPNKPLAEYFWLYARKTVFYEEIIYNNIMQQIRKEIEQTPINLNKRNDYPKKIHCSLENKIIRIITYIPRKIYGGYKCYKDHGFIYTAKRFMQKLLRRGK